MEAKNISFKSTRQEASFFLDARQSINQYFATRNRSFNGNLEMALKCTFWICFWMFSWGLVILFKNNFWIAFMAGLLHMFTHVMLAFNITHDANHFAIFKTKRFNVLLGYLVELIGCNRTLWILAHNQDHHTFINIIEHDNSVEGHKLIRLCPQDKWLKHHKYQWIYAPIIYGLTTLNYVTMRDFKMMLIYHSKSKINLSAGFVLELILFKLLYFSYLIAVPIFIFDVNPQLVFGYFLLGHFINGIFLAFVFLIGHMTEDTDYPNVRDGAIQTNWAVHVIKTTGDYATRTKFMQWFVGGINMHVVHHLFPHICHVHYKNISPILKEVALRHGYKYREIPTFWSAIRSHILLLKTLGKRNVF